MESVKEDFLYVEGKGEANDSFPYQGETTWQTDCARERLSPRGIAEPSWSKYIPGAYSPSRCLSLQGRPMVWAIFALSGCAIMFFGYDTAVMSQVNTNADYLRTMGLYGGSDRDAAGIGGMVSLWFGGFAVGKSEGE